MIRAHRLVSVSVAAFCVATLFTLPACQSGGLAGLMGSSTAIDLLTPMVRDAANSYVSNLSSLTASLKNIHDLQGAMDFVEKARPAVDQLSSSYQTLSGTTGEERSNLVKAFGPKINSVNSDFLGQSKTATGQGMMGRVLQPLVDKVTLFKP